MITGSTIPKAIVKLSRKKTCDRTTRNVPIYNGLRHIEYGPSEITARPLRPPRYRVAQSRMVTAARKQSQPITCAAMSTADPRWICGTEKIVSARQVRSDVAEMTARHWYQKL